MNVSHTAPVSSKKKEDLKHQILARLGRSPKERKQLPKADRSQPIVLSLAQEQMWAEDQAVPGRTDYISSFAVEFHGTLDFVALERAFQALIRRHESLRTTFVSCDGTGHQHVLPHVDFTLNIERDVSNVAQSVRRLSQLPFDLTQAPLVRATVFCVSADVYLLFVQIHHIVTDGWSFGILREELTTFYESALAGARDDEMDALLPVLELQPADFAVIGRSTTAARVHEKALDFWKHHLAGIEPLDLPTDNSRPAVREGNGALRIVDFGPDLLEGLDRLAKAFNTSRFTVMLAAAKVVLSRWSNQQEFLLGTVSAGRDDAHLHNLVGFFVNTLVLRCAVDHNQPFSALVAATGEELTTSLDHASVPFHHVVDALAPERDLSRPTLVQVMTTWTDEGGQAEWDFGRAKAAHKDFEYEQSLFDLSLDFIASPTSLRAVFEFDTELFDVETIDAAGRSLKEFLRNALTMPHTPVHQISMIDATLHDEILSHEHGEFSGTAPCFEPGFFADRVHQLAQQHSERVAVEDAQGALTFGQLEERSERFAENLSESGIGPGDTVLTVLSRSVESVITILGILRTGATYVPVLSNMPAQRLDLIVGLSNPDMVIVTTNTEDVELPTSISKLPTASVSGILSGSIQLHKTANSARTEAADAAYIIFTSGSTGVPKGVEISYGGLQNMIQAYRTKVLDPLPQGELFRAGHLAAWSFDASWDPMVWLLHGHSMVVIDEETRTDADRLVPFLLEKNIDYLDTTPTFMAQLVSQGLLADSRRPWQVLTVGAEALPESLHRDLTADHIVHSYNFYGPTENTVNATVAPIASGHPVTIGRPIPGTQAMVLDEHLRRVPPRVPGELYLAGQSLAKGYVGRQGLTAEKFVSHPDDPGARMYATGDVVRWTHDYEIEFLGRSDDQVKIRGYRIELGEIQVALNQLEDVHNSAVVVREDVPGARRVVAYVEGAGSASTDAQQLREALGAVLPSYMVPAAIVFIDSIPLNANGKADLRQLPAPTSDDVLTTDFLAPRTPTEEALAGAWSELLGLDKVGVRENFFDLGGDSILAIQLLARIRALGFSVSTKDLFKYQDIASLAEALDARQAENKHGSSLLDEVGEVDFNAVQQWFVETHPEQPEIYDMSQLWRLKSSVDLPALMKALGHVIDHHGSLRGKLINGGLKIASSRSADQLGLIQVASEQEAEQAIEGALNQAQTEDRLSGAPLFVARIVSAPENSYLLLIAHHMIVDAVSWQIIAEDLGTAYQTVLDSGEVVLPPTTTNLRSWSETLLSSVSNGEFNKELDSWAELLQDRPLFQLPCDSSEHPNTVNFQRTYTATLPPETTEVLLKRGQGTFRAKIDEILLAALGSALSSWTGSLELIIEKEGHGRTDIGSADLSRVTGWFTTIYPVPFSVVDSASWNERINHVKKQLRHHPAPQTFGALAYLGDPSSTGWMKKYSNLDVSFNYLGRQNAQENHVIIDETLLPPGSPHGTADLRTNLVDITCAATEEGLQVLVVYSSHRHSDVTIQGFVQKFLRELDEISTIASVGGRTMS